MLRPASCSISSSFALACFVGFQVIWNVSHALHTPLMAVTNAISGIIILGALLQIGSSNQIVMILASDLGADRDHQYCWRFHGYTPDAGDVPEKLTGGRVKFR